MVAGPSPQLPISAVFSSSSSTAESAQAGKSFLLTLTYPSQHVLLIKLLVTPCAPIKLVSAEVRPIYM